MNAEGPYVGRAVERLEDARFLRGQGCYVDDLAPDGVLHAVIYRSAIAHGRIRSIATAAARAMPGVHAVFTADEFGAAVPRIPVRIEARGELTRFEQPVIADRKVRYVGEPIAVVVADTAALAEDALSAISVEIDALPSVPHALASQTGSALLFEDEGTNHAFTLTGLHGDAGAAIEVADFVRRERMRVQRHAAVPLETRGVLAHWDAQAGRLRAFGAIKVPFATRAILARLMELPEACVEVIENDAGGGFGVRGEFYPEDFLVPYAARLLGRPVKWVEDRSEHLLATSPAREVECELEIACRRDGTILALRGIAVADMGAYLRPNAITAQRNLAQMIGGPYRVPNLHMDVSMVLTTKTPVASYRGPGRFECDFFRERLFDIAAAELGLDRVAFRQRNLLSTAEIPHALPIVHPLGTRGETDSGDYSVTLQRCLDEIGWAVESPQQGRRADGRHHGLGIGCYLEGGGTGPRENVRLAMAPDGAITVYVGSSSVGQGIETIFAQITADALGVPINRIRDVFHGSTTLVAEGWGSNASRATVMGGSALLDAASNLKAAIRRAAAAQFGCAPEAVELGDGLSTVSAGGLLRTLTELSAEGFSVDGTFASNRRTYSYGAHAAHVAIDARTGALELIDYVAVEDVGRIINPMTLHGQVLGAIVQGLGATLLEHLVYDDQAQLMTGTLADYLLPTAMSFPNIRAVSLEQYPSPHNPLGAKGAGEGGIIPVGGVIANAVAAALAPLGIQPRELPLSPSRLWHMIDASRRLGQ
ncbi:MAG: xanthine dehydrogenase family protein molybdopterin-binding subunit [Proteobacteria bacterium]|nr:xanthine dehydrogenase family protein molybdopterin-binding subunit [Burkholderiales bacterium]